MNFSTLVAAQYYLTAPSGTTLVGNSVEWIVERPQVGSQLATLTNYIDVPWPLGTAWNYQAGSPTYYREGQSNPATGTQQLITMLDNNNQGISSATIENAGFLWFQDFGSACGRSGSPPC